MRTLEDVIIKVDQVNSFMDTIEGVMIDATPDESDPSAKRLHNLMYLLMDLLRAIGDDLAEANGHIHVCNAILASAHVREMEAELKELRAKVAHLDAVP